MKPSIETISIIGAGALGAALIAAERVQTLEKAGKAA